MPEYDAIVYDLDGTLVHLDVDWDAVRDRVAAVLSARGLNVEDANLWEMRGIADEHDLLDRVDERIAEFEREGARSATRLALADELPWSVPVGVCSLNNRAACQIALELNGIDGYVDAVVGRDTTESVKPDSEPLLYVAKQLDVPPGKTLFVGDSDSDRVAAERAGMDFQWVTDRTE